jgi:hypothetical protein
VRRRWTLRCSVAGVILWWLFRTLLGAAIFFVLFGLFSGFDGPLWWWSLLFGAALATEEAWRHRRAGASANVNGGH